MITDYGVSEFLGIFTIFLPVFVYLIVGIQRGILWLFEDILEEISEDKKNFFHHHFHYKAK